MVSLKITVSCKLSISSIPPQRKLGWIKERGKHYCNQRKKNNLAHVSIISPNSSFDADDKTCNKWTMKKTSWNFSRNIVFRLISKLLKQF